MALIPLVPQLWLSGSAQGRAVTPQEGVQAAPDAARVRGQPLLHAPGHGRAVGSRGSGATTPRMKETEAL